MNNIKNNQNNFSKNYNNKEMLLKFLVFALSKNSINNNIYYEIQNLKNAQYIFFTNGLYNNGPSCSMNATLQCLLHVNELVSYFINIYPKDSNNLNNINKDVDSKGQISLSFYNVVKGISSSRYSYNNFNMFINPNSYNYFSSDEFKSTISTYNEQFKNFGENDSKDLILYLFQTIHDELNYLGNNSSLPNYRPNQFDENEAFNYFFEIYKMQNYSIISEIFYGTYKSITTCKQCNSIIYNFQKFELLSFEMFDYKDAIFSLYNGFEDNEKNQELKGDNQFYCNMCRKLCDAEVKTKIIEAPDKLLINIDYGKKKKYQPSAIIIDEFLDITKYALEQKEKLKYRLIGVCKNLNYPQSSDDYIAYCKDKTSNNWYKFNDAECSICYTNEVTQGNPYLLLYEKIN
jgi:ubiquitin C-terminal hydrolase